LTYFHVSNSFALLSCNNKVPIHVTNNPSHHERNKHLEIDLQYVREQVEKGILRPIHVRKHHQIVDVFTKALSKTSFLPIISKMGINNVLLPS